MASRLVCSSCPTACGDIYPTKEPVCRFFALASLAIVVFKTSSAGNGLTGSGLSPYPLSLTRFPPSPLRGFVPSCEIFSLRLTHSDDGAMSPRLQRRNAPTPPWRRRTNSPSNLLKPHMLARRSAHRGAT
jgi:hypothetical protein